MLGGRHSYMCRLRINELFDLLRNEIDIRSGNVAVPLHGQVDRKITTTPEQSVPPHLCAIGSAKPRAVRYESRGPSWPQIDLLHLGRFDEFRRNGLHRFAEFQLRDLLKVFIHKSLV